MKHFITSTLCILILFAGRAQNSGVMKQVVIAEYRTWYITQDGKVWAYNNSSALPVQFPIGGLKADTGAGGFNYFRILDEQGYVWTSKIDYTVNTTRIDKDTTGAAFSGNWYIDAYGHAGLTIRADSSIWLFGQDIYALVYPGGSPILMTGTSIAPTRLSPVGMKFKKALFGGGSILALTTSGQVYQWLAGSKTPTLISTVRPATDIFISHLNAAGCIIPDPGENSGMGYPYIWGGTGSMWGGTNSTTPVSVKSLWNMTSPIREISMDWNTIHYIDSLGNMYGCGFNSFGEVGNGVEFINKYNYPGFPGYGWSLIDYENPSGIPTQIGKGVKWKHIYSNNWFGFYKYAMDQNDSIYSWGRNKSLALGNGMWNGYDGGEFHPNTLDVIKPTMVHPFTSIFTEYGFIPPSISVGAPQIVSTSTATLKGVAQPALCIAVRKPAPNGIDTAGYKIVSYQWTKVSGPASGTITSPNAATTTVTNLSAGTYVFNLLTTDNNTGTLSANDTIIVTSTAPGAITVNAGSNQTITLPSSSATLVGSASQVNGTITAYKWTEVSGPSTVSISNSTSAQASVTGLVQGVYKFQLLVTTAAGTTAASTVQVTVNAAVGAVVVSAGSNQTITLPTSSITLAGSASQTNGSIASYKWTQVSGPSTAGITTPTQATTTVTGLVKGTYQFQLMATSALGTTATSTVQVTVNAAVTSPGTITVSAGADQTIKLPANYTNLIGTASVTGGTIVSYKWTEVSGPSTITIAGAATAQASLSSLVQGVYVFQLQVTTSFGTTGQATVQITVTGTSSATITVNAGANQTLTLPANYTNLIGSASVTGGSISAYKWTEVSGPSTVTISGAATSQASISGLVQGVYVFQLLVTTNLGATATATSQVTVNGSGSGSGGTTTYQAIPGTIQAESYATMSGVQTETTSDTGGGQDVGWIDAGDQMNYNVNVAAAGTYTASFRVSSLTGSASFTVLDGQGNLLATVNVPNTGGYQAWTTVTATITLAAGQQKLSIVSQSANGWNFNWMQFDQAAPSGKLIPGTIQAEDYDGMLGVAPENTSDVGGGLDIGKLGAPGNQVGYYVTVAAAGTYTANFRVASPVTGAVFQLLDTRNAVLATVSVPNTGGWQVWTTVSTTVTLPAGSVFLKVVSQNANGWNFNWMSFVTKTTTTTVVRGVTTNGVSNDISASAPDSAGANQPARLHLYPNPVVDIVTIDLVNNYTGRLDVQVIGMTGAVVRRFELNKGLSSMQTPVSLSGLTPGVYIIRVSGTDWSMTSKILKK